MTRKPRGLGVIGRNVYSASNSFTEAEIQALDTALTIMLRGGDPRVVARSPAMQSLAKKFQRMKLTIARNRALTEKTAATKPEQCTCEDAMAEQFELNPTGHYVGCPLWGTLHKNRHAFGFAGEAMAASEPEAVPT